MNEAKLELDFRFKTKEGLGNIFVSTFGVWKLRLLMTLVKPETFLEGAGCTRCTSATDRS